jgi:Leucine-rich repeat (LRR) protein
MIEYRTKNSSSIDEVLHDFDLLMEPNYDNIIWIRFINIKFNYKFKLPSNLQQLYIDKCSDLELLLELPDSIQFAEIINCKCNDLNFLFKNNLPLLETLNLSGNRLDKIPIIPSNLISLNLSNNTIRNLPPTNCFHDNLHSIDLSYNQLRELPRWILDLNEHTIINLMPNKFWFNYYNNISLNRLIHDHDIAIGNRFFGSYIFNVLDDNTGKHIKLNCTPEQASSMSLFV